jgi:hypothetical protein
LKVLIKLFQKFFGSRRRNGGRVPQNAKYSFCLKEKRSEKLGMPHTRVQIPNFWLVFSNIKSIKSDSLFARPEKQAKI